MSCPNDSLLGVPWLATTASYHSLPLLTSGLRGLKGSEERGRPGQTKSLGDLGETGETVVSGNGSG